MRAFGLTEYGGPEVMREVWLRREPLGAGQVRLRVTAAAVSPTDSVLRSGSRAVEDSPPGAVAVPGMEAAGEVMEVGEGVTAVAVGDRVIAIVVPAGEHGAYRTDLVLPEESVVRAPSASSDAEAATLPMNGLTAWLALETLALEPSATLAVTGAAGIFGGYQESSEGM